MPKRETGEQLARGTRTACFLLAGLDILTRLGYEDDERLGPALEHLRKKRQKDGRWIMDAIHPDPPSYARRKGNLRRRVKPFALENVGEPSKRITLTAMRVLRSVEEAS